MKSILKWTGIALVALVAAPLLIVIAINIPDEELAPHAAAYGAPRAPAVPDAENGYFAMLAMNASDGADGMAYAQAWLAEARAAARENRAETLLPTQRAQRPNWCDPRTTPCLAYVRDKRAEVEQQLEAFNEDLVRYEALLAFKRYEEVLDYRMRAEFGFPPYLPMVRAQQAYLLRIALAVEAGRVDEAVTALERELAWQRTFLRGSRLVLGKAVALANHWRDLMFIADLLRTRPAEMLPFIPRLQALLAPLDAALRAGAVLETEFSFAKAGFDEVSSGKGERWESAPERIVIALFFKRNATVNRLHQHFSSLAASVFEVPAHRVEAGWEAFSKAWLAPPFWDYIYNPAGKFLLALGTPGWKDYPYQSHDLVALNRLVALRVELLASGVTANEVPQAIARSAMRFHDPHTLKPLRWDAEKKRIYYEARGERTRKLTFGVDNGRVFLEL